MFRLKGRDPLRQDEKEAALYRRHLRRDPLRQDEKEAALYGRHLLYRRGKGPHEAKFENEKELPPHLYYFPLSEPYAPHPYQHPDLAYRVPHYQEGPGGDLKSADLDYRAEGRPQKMWGCPWPSWQYHLKEAVALTQVRGMPVKEMD